MSEHGVINDFIMFFYNYYVVFCSFSHCFGVTGWV